MMCFSLVGYNPPCGICHSIFWCPLGYLKLFPFQVSKKNVPMELKFPELYYTVDWLVQKSGEKTSWGNGSLSHYLQGFIDFRWFSRQISKPINSTWVFR